MAGRGRHAGVLGTLSTAEASTKEVGTTSSSPLGEDFRSGCSGSFDDRWRALPLNRGSSYVHTVTLPLFTHVVQGCLASHLCGWG